jgi:hypothetical protein
MVGLPGGPSRRFLCVALLFAFAFSGCGGDGETGTSDSQQEVVSARSAPFARYSGHGLAKLRLAEFGTEADRVDRLKAERTLDAYLAASGKDEWGRACRYISEILRRQIAEIARRAKPNFDSSCGAILGVLASSSAKQKGAPPLSAPDGVASMRIKEGPGGGFVLFHGSDGADHWAAVHREMNEWKILSAVPQKFE